MEKAAFVLLVALGVAACSGSSAGNPDGAAANLVGVQCGWSASLDDAGPGACRASRTYVDCHDPAGDGCSCVSDGPQTCDCSGFVNGGPWTCHYACGANQYTVSCGSVGPSAQPPPAPPAGCTSVGANPAGVVTYCCPCG